MNNKTGKYTNVLALAAIIVALTAIIITIVVMVIALCLTVRIPQTLQRIQTSADGRGKTDPRAVVTIRIKETKAMVKTKSRDESNSLTVEAQAAITISIKPKERKGDFAVMMLGEARPIDIINAMAAGAAPMIRMIGKEKYTLCEETKRIFMEELDEKMRMGAFEKEICKITPVGREDKVHWNDEPKAETAV